mmetsp:Transcript_38506/g.90910  ORF Transcript_38506/g.90910 Transcript_38506/m.90910 type:complete len:312 (+) Transcript_38506:107-1042(+)
MHRGGRPAFEPRVQRGAAERAAADAGAAAIWKRQGAEQRPAAVCVEERTRRTAAPEKHHQRRGRAHFRQLQAQRQNAQALREARLPFPHLHRARTPGEDGETRLWTHVVRAQIAPDARASRGSVADGGPERSAAEPSGQGVWRHLRLRPVHPALPGHPACARQQLLQPRLRARCPVHPGRRDRVGVHPGSEPSEPADPAQLQLLRSRQPAALLHHIHSAGLRHGVDDGPTAADQRPQVLAQVLSARVLHRSLRGCARRVRAPRLLRTRPRPQHHLPDHSLGPSLGFSLVLGSDSEHNCVVGHQAAQARRRR